MKFTRVISILIATALVYSSMPPTQAAVVDKHIISDINDHWAESHITTLTYADILRGSGGMANPDNNITRGEFAALVSRTLSLSAKDTDLFYDVPKEHIFRKEITSAAQAGIIKGVGNGIFAPEMNITREEIMLMISRCIPKKSGNVSFKDINKKYPYITELKTAVNSGIISGFEDNTFRPASLATRGECAAMLIRLLESEADISKSSALSLAQNYIKNDLASPELNSELSVGLAKEDIDLKLDAGKRLTKNSVNVQKLLDNFELTDFESHGSLAKAVYSGDITYVTASKDESRNRNYEATFTVDIIKRNENIFVYNYKLDLKKKERINLTWEVYSTVPDYAPVGVNVISPSSFQISAENTGVENKPLLNGINFYNSLTRKYMDYASKNGYEVWPIYKTDFSLKTSDAFLNSPSARKQSLTYLLDYACKYMFDGINFDFENVYERNRHLITKHVRDATVMLHEMGLITSADITRKETTSPNWSMCYDRDSLADNCDYIMLMAYDEHYSSSKSAGSVASLDWTEDSVKRTLKEVPEDKLILGVPFYMRYFEVTGTKVTSTKAIGMQTAYDLIQANNPTYTYMTEDRQYKISWQKGNKKCIFWLENSDTMADRVNIANKYNLAGIASWRRGLEVSNIWKVIDENLK